MPPTTTVLQASTLSGAFVLSLTGALMTAAAIFDHSRSLIIEGLLIIVIGFALFIRYLWLRTHQSRL